MDKFLQSIALIIGCALLAGLIWFYGVNYDAVAEISDLANANEPLDFLLGGAAVGAVLAIIVVLRR